MRLPTTTRHLGQTLRDWRIVYGRRHYRHLAAALLGAAPRRLRRLARDYGLVALLLITIAALGVACYRVAVLPAPPAPAVEPLLTKAEPIVVFQTVLPTAAPTQPPQPTPEPQIVYVDRVVERVVEVPVPAAPIVVEVTAPPAAAAPPAAEPTPATLPTTAAIILSKLPFAETEPPAPRPTERCGTYTYQDGRLVGCQP